MELARKVLPVIKILYYCLCSALLYFPAHSIAKQKILVIESYHCDFDWDISYTQGIRSVLQDQFELYFFQMDTKRIETSLYQERADRAWAIYNQLDPDLVILGDDNAVQYLSDYFVQVTTPVIYLGLNNNPRHYNIHQSQNISGVLERPLLKRAIPVIDQILSQKLKRVLVLFDDSIVAETIVKEDFSSDIQMEILGIEVNIQQVGDWSDWKQAVLSSADNNYDALFIGLFHTLKDSNGQHVPEEQVIEWSAANTPIPPFGFWDYSIGENKNIGGLVIFGFEQGKLAAEMAKEILLNGVPPSQLRAKTAEKGRYLFSRKALQKYDLTLPENIAKKATYIE
jgi:ABC-type uncharacterized transport system substrate-binding protein